MPSETQDHEYWMRIALAEAEAARAVEEVPVGAVVVVGGEILARGRNECEARRDATAHAELLALRVALSRVEFQRLPDATLYCTLEPCFMCAGALLLTRVKKLVFAARDPKFGAVRSLGGVLEHSGTNHVVEVVEGVLAEESSRLLKGFFRELRRQHPPTP
jgi:tRNA(adenine34) deaminase